MQAVDRAAIETYRIPRLLLMEHAGWAVANAARRLLPNGPTRILICCGQGFNGGDGLAAARHLHADGHSLRLLLMGRVSDLREEPATYAAMLAALHVSVQEVASPAALGLLDDALRECGLVIDALLGIGAQGTVREPMASMIRRINASGKPVLAVDLPSGLHGDTGAVQGVAVRAAATVAFGAVKRGCLVGEGPAHAGAVSVDSITFPPMLLQAARA